MTEHQEQVELIRLILLHTGRWPELSLLFAIPNGGARHIAVARKLKAEGVKMGVPDLFLPVARQGYHGLFIEMKRQKNGKLTREQCEWVKALEWQGYMAVVCKGATAAWEVIQEYMQA